jgi:hypothetical protein
MTLIVDIGKDKTGCGTKSYALDVQCNILPLHVLDPLDALFPLTNLTWWQ